MPSNTFLSGVWPRPWVPRFAERSKQFAHPRLEVLPVLSFLENNGVPGRNSVQCILRQERRNTKATDKGRSSVKQLVGTKVRQPRLSSDKRTGLSDFVATRRHVPSLLLLSFPKPYLYRDRLCTVERGSLGSLSFFVEEPVVALENDS